MCIFSPCFPPRVHNSQRFPNSGLHPSLPEWRRWTTRSANPLFSALYRTSGPISYLIKYRAHSIFGLRFIGPSSSMLCHVFTTQPHIIITTMWHSLMNMNMVRESYALIWRTIIDLHRSKCADVCLRSNKPPYIRLRHTFIPLVKKSKQSCNLPSGHNAAV